MVEEFAPGAYRLTESDRDGVVVANGVELSAAAAGHLISGIVRRADRQLEGRKALVDSASFLLDPATDASGRLTLRRRFLSFGRGEGDVIEQWRTWRLEPVSTVRLSATQVDDLTALRDSQHFAHGDLAGARVRGGVLRTNRVGSKSLQRVDCSGMYSLPPAAWRRLVEKGWAYIVGGQVEDGAAVRISAAGLVALALRDHRTSTTSPQGWHKSADSSDAGTRASGVVGMWRKGGRIYDGTSFVVCSGRCFSGRLLDTRALAQSEARAHRAEMIALALGAGGQQAQAAGARARAVAGGVKSPGAAWS
ncbi:hypothetical protein AB0O47_40155 [Streptomyces noursei]|uniref:hypothetical protein n=1 Tax=Streptomyces noursei TaxID=1971 RepID=UPI003450EC27